MKFTIKPSDVTKLDVDVLIVYCFEEKITQVLQMIPSLSDIIHDASIKELFLGKEGQTLIISTKSLLASYKLQVSGVGQDKDFDYYRLQKMVSISIKKVQSLKPAKIAICVPEVWMHQFTTTTTIKAIVEAVSLSTYRFHKYKTDNDLKQDRDIEEVILNVSANKISASENGLRQGLIYSEATTYVRDLVNEPPQITTPTYLAKEATNLNKTSKNIVTVDIFDHIEIAKLGMNAFLGVAKGSDESPKFIHLKYKSKNPQKKVVLIGKGITFDTGGLSLKGAQYMETMKLDMAGAASILGVFQALIKMQPKLNVIGLIAACENMPSGKALKPGDILKAMNGKTIEVLNTDAEGRLTLADMLSYAVLKEKPDLIVDIATLTGACVVSLGEEIAGLWGNDNVTIEKMKEASKNSGERIWHMPLEMEYKDLNKSQIADIKNIQTGKYAGAITAALFLSEFTSHIPWIHLDIAGPAFTEKNTPLALCGGTGFGVRLLLEFLSSI